MVSLLLLSKKNPFLLLLILLSLVSTNSMLYSQVKIKEKVGINPVLPRLSTTTNYSPIEFLFNGARPYSVAVSGPGTISISGSCAGYGTPLLLLTTPATNGTYQVSVSSGEEYVSTVGFSVTWLAPDGNTRFLAGYEMAFYFGGTRTATFTFNEIPPPPPQFDFQISFDNPLAYANDRSLFIIQYNHDSEPQDKSVTLSFAAADQDVVFFDEMLQEELGSSITASLDDYDRYSVTCKSLNSSFPKKVKVLGVSNGLQRSDTLTILQSEYVRAYFEKESLSPGDTVNIIVKKVNNKYGWESNYPDTTHFEVGVKEGCGLGMIMDAGGTKRDYFSSIQQPIRFVVADYIRVDADSVVLRVGAPIVEKGDVVASSVIPTGNNLQKNKNAVNQNMNISTALDLNRKFIAKAVNNDYCAAGNYTYTNVDFPVGKISGDCEKTAKCKTTNPPVVPTFDLIPEPLKFTHNECDNDTLRGGFGPPIIAENYARSPAAGDIKVCYNTNEKHWQINIEPANKILINYTLDFCYDNIKRMHKNALFHITDVDTISTLNIVKAYDDIESQRKYGGGGDYYVFEATVAHENVHKRDFIRIMNDLFNDDNVHFKADYLRFKPECTEIKNETEVLKSAQGHVNDWIKVFSVQLQFRWGLESESEGYEQNVQGDDSVQNVLNNYIQRLSI